MAVRHLPTSIANAEGPTETTAMGGCMMTIHHPRTLGASNITDSKALPFTRATRLLRMVIHKQEARTTHMARLLILPCLRPQ